MTNSTGIGTPRAHNRMYPSLPSCFRRHCCSFSISPPDKNVCYRRRAAMAVPARRPLWGKALLGVELRRLHHALGIGDVLREELAEFIGIAGEEIGALAGKTLAHLGRRERLRQRSLHALDDRPRRA